jgi:hypothetical protein
MQSVLQLTHNGTRRTEHNLTRTYRTRIFSADTGAHRYLGKPSSGDENNSCVEEAPASAGHE